MFDRKRFGALLIASALTSLPLSAMASDGGMGGLGLPAARGPTYDPNKEFHAGVDALAEGKYRAAKQDFEHVLAMIPAQPAALYMLAQSEAGLGDYRSAVRDYEASLRIDPKQVVPARDLAITDEKLGRHDKAVAQLRLLKDRADACGDSCAEAGDLQGAVRDVEAVVAPPGAPAKAPAG
jgi:tetratricopeptide (TPR) repeat protein